MYGIYTYIYPKNLPNVGKYTSPMDGMGILILGKEKNGYIYIYEQPPLFGKERNSLWMETFFFKSTLPMGTR